MKTILVLLSLLGLTLYVTQCAADAVPFPSRFYINPGALLNYYGETPATTIDIPASLLDYRIPSKPDFVYRGLFSLGVTATGVRSRESLVGSVWTESGRAPLRPLAMALTPRDYHFYSAGVPVCVIVQIRGQTHHTTGFDRVIWESPCKPIDTSVPTECTQTGNVLLDHGVVTLGDSISVTSAELIITCNAAATGHLTLSAANDRIPLGLGYSTIKTSNGPLNAPLSLTTGANIVVLTSELTGVGAGSWSGNGVLSLNLD